MCSLHRYLFPAFLASSTSLRHGRVPYVMKDLLLCMGQVGYRMKYSYTYTARRPPTATSAGLGPEISTPALPTSQYFSLSALLQLPNIFVYPSCHTEHSVPPILGGSFCTPSPCLLALQTVHTFCVNTSRAAFAATLRPSNKIQVVP